MLNSAHNIRCYSLSNGFSGAPLTDRPMIWGEMRPGDTSRPLIEVSPIAYLKHELETKSTKLIDSGSGRYTIHVHSNLWFTFEALRAIA